MEVTISYLLILQKIYQFKANGSEMKPCPLFLGNISKDFTIDNVKKTELKGSVNFFSADCRGISTNKIGDIHRF